MLVPARALFETKTLVSAKFQKGASLLLFTAYTRGNRMWWLRVWLWNPTG